MKFSLRNPFFIFGLVLLWRVIMLVFTAQPIPANDAFCYDGPVVNWLRQGHYVNPSMAEIFPISGREVYSTYPPLYQGVLLVWMQIFGTGVLSAMSLHLALFAGCGLLALIIVKRFFPAATNYALVAWLFFGYTFCDRPDDLAHVFGLVTLWLVARQMARANAGAKTALGLTLVLLLALYTSMIIGAFYFGAGGLACAVVWWRRRQNLLLAPFIAAAVLFALVTYCIAHVEPLWWRGFMENARQQTVVSRGFHLPAASELIKLVRTAPVFLLALPLLPLVWLRRKQIPAGENAWLVLLAGIFLMGWILLAASVTLLASNYVGYVVFTQIILAAGLLALVEKVFPEKLHGLRVLMVCCAVLVSIRAVGMTTWGAACAWGNSQGRTQETLRAELEPFTKTNTPVIVSSAFLYSAAEFGVQNPIHSDWYFDHVTWTNHAQVNALVRLRPAKLVLVQFDYYRGFESLLDELRARPEIAGVRVRNLAVVRTPDSMPSLQRVVQHISWAPVIVDLDWKK
jgi:hypothetical protein